MYCKEVKRKGEGNMENGFEMICLELIEEVIINGAKMDGEIYNGTFLDGKPLELEEFMNILVTNNIRRFLQIEMDNDDKMTSYKDMIKFGDKGPDESVEVQGRSALFRVFKRCFFCAFFMFALFHVL